MKCADKKFAIKAEGLTKKYRILDSPLQRISYYMFNSNVGADFCALENVSFEILPGETFGIIGRNGSGKSTLLQILAGIIDASSGKLQVTGKIAALLELGSGFNPESTGYENIFMNAAILGVNKKGIERKVKEIIDFADIGEFINQPVKTYSSGMFIRLAFAVAINVEASIILIDEALAVGDVFFRQKCYKKLNELKKEGKTIILVSHGMNEVEQFCDRAMLLSHGKVLAIGPSRDIVKKYYILDQKKEEIGLCDSTVRKVVENDNKTVHAENISFGNWEKKDDLYFDISQIMQVNALKNQIKRVGLFDENGVSRRVFEQGEYGFFYVETVISENINVPTMGIVIFNQKNTIVHGKDSLQCCVNNLPEHVEQGNSVFWLQKIQFNLAVGDYTFDVGTGNIPCEIYNDRMNMNQEELDGYLERLAMLTKVGSFSVHTRKSGYPTKLMFHGEAGLPDDIYVCMREE